MKTTFLFGSGADTDACRDLPSGQGFAAALLKNRYSAAIKSIAGIDEHFQLVYHSSRKVFIQTIANWKDEAEQVFGKSIVEQFIGYYQGNAASDCYKERISPKCEEFYNALKDENESEIQEFFLKYAVFFDSLDEKFNSLRSTDYNSNAKRVINAYFTVFLLMLEKLYGSEEPFTTFQQVLDKLRQDYAVSLSEESYYTLLASSRIPCSIVTTNYTKIIEQQIPDSDPIFLHGKLTWFEDLERLQVYDCEDAAEYKQLENRIALSGESSPTRIVPFILIPSGVKPLICKKQIEAFHRFIEVLEESENLVVVGYRFNSEDNHINSIIAEWLRGNRHKLIYLNYQESVKLEHLQWLSDFKEHIVETNENMLSLDSKDSKIFTRTIDSANAHEVFAGVLRKLEAL